MSIADIQYIPITSDPARCRYDTSELEQANIWLAGRLEEARETQSNIARWNLSQTVMLAVTVTLLVLTWTGYISI